MNKSKKILLAVVVTNLLCTFVAGHGGIPLGVLELLTLYSAITFNFDEFPLLSLWTLAAVLMLLGQILIFVAFKKQNEADFKKFGRYGTILLTLPIIFIPFILEEMVWSAADISSLPFLILTFIFWWTTRSSKEELLMNEI